MFNYDILDLPILQLKVARFFWSIFRLLSSGKSVKKQWIGCEISHLQFVRHKFETIKWLEKAECPQHMFVDFARFILWILWCQGGQRTVTLPQPWRGKRCQRFLCSCVANCYPLLITKCGLMSGLQTCRGYGWTEQKLICIDFSCVNNMLWRTHAAFRHQMFFLSVSIFSNWLYG